MEIVGFVICWWGDGLAHIMLTGLGDGDPREGVLYICPFSLSLSGGAICGLLGTWRSRWWSRRNDDSSPWNQSGGFLSVLMTKLSLINTNLKVFYDKVIHNFIFSFSATLYFCNSWLYYDYGVSAFLYLNRRRQQKSFLPCIWLIPYWRTCGALVMRAFFNRILLMCSVMFSTRCVPQRLILVWIGVVNFHNYL